MTAPDEGALLGHGRTSEVYAYGVGTAIKVYPEGTDRALVAQERDAATLVHALGVPSVRCLGLAERSGRPGVVFDRLTGPGIARQAEKDPRRLPEMSRTLADLHARVHEARTDALPDVRDLAVSLLDTPRLRTLGTVTRTRLRARFRDLPDGDSVLHLDFHPQNVYEHHEGHAVIDWQSACRGPAAADVAMSVVLMREVELFPGTPPLLLALYAASRRAVLRYYLARYLAVSGLTPAEVERWLTCARVLRLGLLDVPSERRRFLRRIEAGSAAVGGPA
ncbi:phosphotransferase family protein [Cellulomonas triticagri]|uniref:phosphotransferase family protein n=1 Tax=Cellulomonas triticagri TaxID=2483352 RepID=UPI0013150E13|nr:aminoglycoside phosphotransferase family protein [Cellulomonas triticagri]